MFVSNYIMLFFVAGLIAKIAVNVLSQGTVYSVSHKMACIVLKMLGLGDVTIFGDFRPLGA